VQEDFRWLTARPIAHRGFHDIAKGRPENSLAAFDAAVRAGYAIECDLHLSADNIPVVFHDDDLRRLTGAGGTVDGCSAVGLGRLRIMGTEERIPTLDQMLQRVAGRVPLVIELKNAPEREMSFARQVATALKKYPGKAAVMSFDPALLAWVRKADPKLPIGLIAAGNWRAAARLLAATWNLRVDFISYGIDDLPTPFPILASKLMHIPLICWTVRSKPQLEKAKRWTDQITFEGFQA
jgi:glycerophosphoryl diester phosphodiesterase